MTDRTSTSVLPVTRNLFPLWFLDSAENVGSKPTVTQHVSPPVLQRHDISNLRISSSHSAFGTPI